jgi:hypothetical protein
VPLLWDWAEDFRTAPEAARICQFRLLDSSLGFLTEMRWLEVFHPDRTAEFIPTVVTVASAVVTCGFIWRKSVACAVVVIDVGGRALTLETRQTSQRKVDSIRSKSLYFRTGKVGSQYRGHPGTRCH